VQRGHFATTETSECSAQHYGDLRSGRMSDAQLRARGAASRGAQAQIRFAHLMLSLRNNVCHSASPHSRDGHTRCSQREGPRRPPNPACRITRRPQLTDDKTGAATAAWLRFAVRVWPTDRLCLHLLVVRRLLFVNDRIRVSPLRVAAPEKAGRCCRKLRQSFHNRLGRCRCARPERLATTLKPFLRA
jgi:hypothetical protein